MSTILPQAQALVSTLKTLMPSTYQQESLQALLGLFLAGRGTLLPEHCQTKSASALSRFLNEYKWSTRQLIREVRSAAVQQILSQPRLGRRPTLQVILDLTTLEKVGKFKEFKDLIRVYNGKRGLHIVLLYLVVGKWRVPWAFQVYRGKDTPSPTGLGLRLLRRLPKVLTGRFEILVLADTAFGTNEFITKLRRLKYHTLVGLPCHRKLSDGRRLAHLHKRGQQVRLLGLKFSVHLSWYYLKRSDGKLEKRYILSTKALKGSTMTWWGRRRWAIEGFFKTGPRNLLKVAHPSPKIPRLRQINSIHGWATLSRIMLGAKHRFGLHRFGQQTLLGVYRWLVLSLTAYLLSHWVYLHLGRGAMPDWGAAAQQALELLLPLMALLPLLAKFQRLRPLAKSYGLDINLTWCKI